MKLKTAKEMYILHNQKVMIALLLNILVKMLVQNT